MRTYTVTEKHRAVQEGKMAKSEFVRQMRLGYPEHITQWNGYDDTVQILKNRGLLFETAKPVVVEEKIDAMKLPYSLESLDRGIRYEFAAAGIDYHAGARINIEQYNEALNKAKANLDKDPMHYLNLVSGESSNVDKNDQLRPVSNKPDVFNGMKKADLREAKVLLKEGKMDDLAEKLGIDVGRLQAAADRLREMEREDAAETAGKVQAMKDIIGEEPDEVMNIDRFGKEKEDKDSNYTKVKEAEEMDQEEYHLKRKEAANAAIDILRRKYPEVTAGILKDFLRTHMDDLYGGADPIEEFENYVSVNYDSLSENENIEAFSDTIQVVGYPETVEDALKVIERYERDRDPVSREEAKEIIADMRATDDDDFDRNITNLIVKAFNIKLKGISEKKGKDHDGDGDVDGDDYMAAKDKAIKKAMGKDDEKNEQLKEAIKKIIKKSLTKDTLNEAATNHLAAMADTYGDYKGMTVVLNDLQNIVTDIESYYAKQKERLQGVFKKVGEIQNEEGFKVGGFLAPAIESAFVKDSRHLGGNRFMKGVEIPQVKVAKFDNLRQEEAPVEAEAAPKETVFGINEKK